MKLPSILFAFALVLSIPAFSQGTISGKIIDAETRLPLQGASVFAQNTTRGTVTDKEGNFSLYLNKGGYEVIISFTGYTSRLINYEAVSDRNFTLEMERTDNSLSEVIIQNTNEVADGWEQYGNFFTRHFIGATPFAAKTVLLNPEVLKFYYYKRNDRLKILATEPLEIRNEALGYIMRYELDSFVHFFGNGINSYRGFCFFSEMDGTEEEKMLWKQNREQAYLGSRLHFIRSYFDSSLKENGFTVDMLSKTIANKFDRLTNPYDSVYYYFDNENYDAELWFPVKASIIYHKKAPEAEYLQQYNLPADVQKQISYVDLSDAILIKPNGYFIDQKSWINQGYWSWKNLADLLPYDYEVEDSSVE